MERELKIEEWLDGRGENDNCWLNVKRLVVPGAKLRIDYGKDNYNSKVIHIRSIIDNHYIVYRHWLKTKKRWNYVVEFDYYFFLLVKDGKLLK